MGTEDLASIKKANCIKRIRDNESTKTDTKSQEKKRQRHVLVQFKH